MHQMHIINMKSNNSNNRSSSNKDRMIFPSSLDKQERTTSTESTISTGSGHIKDMLLSPIASCKSPSSVTEMNNVAPSYCCTPSHMKLSNQQSRVVESSSYQQQHPNGRKKAVYRNRTSPPLYSKKSMPKTRSNPSLSSSQDSYGVVEECTRHTSSAAAAALLNGENLLDKAALDPCNSWNDDAESSLYSYSSQDQLLTNNNNNNKTIISQHPPPSCSSYDCNYKYTQETAYEDFGVERKLIDKSNMRQSSSTSSATHQSSSGIIGGKKKKHWIRLRQSISTQSQALTLPSSRKPSSFTGSLKKATSLGSASSTLPPSGKSFAPKKSPPPAVRTGSAPPTYFHVDIKDGQYSSSSVGYHSAPIETELRPDQSLSQMGMEVTEEDYCIEGEYMARQFQQLQEQQQEEEHTASGCSSNQRKGSNKKFSESVFSMKELAKGLEGLSMTRKKPCSPKVIKTKVLSALRRGSGSDTTTDASEKKKKIPHQIAITVTPSTSEDTGDDHLSLEDMQLLYKWQHARCRNDFNQFLSRRRMVSCNTDDDCTRVEMAITKKTSEDVMSITSSVGDRTVSVDNRRCSIQRQVSF